MAAQALNKSARTFKIMYAIDGEIIEKIEDIEEDTQVVIASESSDVFKGVIN